MINLAIFMVVIGFGSVFGYTILEPVAKVARGNQTPSNFYVADFFSLSFLLAIPLVFVGTVRRWRGEDSNIVNALGFILVALFAYIWWRGTMTLTGVGVLRTGRRCLFVGILLPIALLGSAIGIPVLVGLSFTLPRMSATGVIAWLGGIVATPIIAWSCRKATLWVLSNTGDSQDIIPLEEVKSQS